MLARRPSSTYSLSHLPRATFLAALPARRYRSRPCRSAHPETFNQWTRQYSRLCVSRVVRGGKARDRRLRVDQGGARRRPLGTRQPDPGRSERGRAISVRRNPPSRTTTCSRSARSSRARTCSGSPGRHGSSASSSAWPESPAGAASTWAGACADSAACPTRARGSQAARALSPPVVARRVRAPGVIEAMACGTPVVTSCGGATEEVAGGALSSRSARRRVDRERDRGAARRKSDLRALGLERARASPVKRARTLEPEGPQV